jgi:hypothetical protein
MTDTVAFQMNGTWYTTDAETLSVLHSTVPAAKASKDTSAVAAIMALGLATGRIRTAQ